MGMKFLDMFKEDCRYYDPDGVEIKTVLKNVDIKNKIILDVGAGIGRLSFPLAKYAKEVIALDSDRKFNEYFKKHKKDNLRFVNQKAEHFLRRKLNVDIFLLAWPTINFKFVSLIKKSMNEESMLVFIICDSNSDFETIIDKLNVFEKDSFKEDIKNKIKFLSIIPKKFKILIKKNIKTRYVYPNERIAFNALKNFVTLWYNINLNKNGQKRLREIIKKHKEGGKIIFGEKIYFYLLKK
ncbi:MAG: rRNA adenine N-6-methyltransferase family protein [Nanoarchaeota archaeon]|mgnify:CR=1 FL=1